MTLMFGNLTVAFVDFGRAAAEAFQSPSPSTFQQLDEAADHFRDTAARDASYLVYIGMPLLPLFLRIQMF